MPSPKLLGGNPVTDGDPLQVQVMTALELSAAAISSLTTALEHISATIEGPFGQGTAAQSVPVVETGPITASPGANDIAQDIAVTVVAATFAAGSAPSGATNGYRVNLRGYGGRIRTLIDYTGSVTACNVRLYTREPGGTAWYRGVSTDESGYPLAPASGDESRDWDIGEGVEFLFVVESISPGTSGNTVAIKAAGVAR